MNQENLFEIEYRQLLVEKLARLLTTLNKNVSDERAKAIARQAEIRELYPTEDDAHEAFGNGYITEDEYYDIVDRLAIVDRPTVISAARDELRDFMSQLRKNIRDLEWESKPEEEKERIRNNHASMVQGQRDPMFK